MGTIKNWINLQPTAIHFAIIARAGKVVEIKPKVFIASWDGTWLGRVFRTPGVRI